MSDWIACSDRLPETSEINSGYFRSKLVIGWSRMFGIALFWYINDKDDADVSARQRWEDAEYSAYDLGDITHWMPLPEPPQ